MISPGPIWCRRFFIQLAPETALLVHRFHCTRLDRGGPGPIASARTKPIGPVARLSNLIQDPIPDPVESVPGLMRPRWIGADRAAALASWAGLRLFSHQQELGRWRSAAIPKPRVAGAKIRQLGLGHRVVPCHDRSLSSRPDRAKTPSGRDIPNTHSGVLFQTQFWTNNASRTGSVRRVADVRGPTLTGWHGSAQAPAEGSNGSSEFCAGVGKIACDPKAPKSVSLNSYGSLAKTH